MCKKSVLLLWTNCGTVGTFPNRKKDTMWSKPHFCVAWVRRRRGTLPIRILERGNYAEILMEWDAKVLWFTKRIAAVTSCLFASQSLCQSARSPKCQEKQPINLWHTKSYLNILPPIHTIPCPWKIPDLPPFHHLPPVYKDSLKWPQSTKSFSADLAPQLLLEGLRLVKIGNSHWQPSDHHYFQPQCLAAR